MVPKPDFLVCETYAFLKSSKGPFISIRHTVACKKYIPNETLRWNFGRIRYNSRDVSWHWLVLTTLANWHRSVIKYGKLGLGKTNLLTTSQHYYLAMTHNEYHLHIPDMGLQYPVYSRKSLRNFQSPEKSRNKEWMFGKSFKRRTKSDRDPACILYITGKKHATFQEIQTTLHCEYK